MSVSSDGPLPGGTHSIADLGLTYPTGAASAPAAFVPKKVPQNPVPIAPKASVHLDDAREWVYTEPPEATWEELSTGMSPRFWIQMFERLRDFTNGISLKEIHKHIPRALPVLTRRRMVMSASTLAAIAVISASFFLFVEDDKDRIAETSRPTQKVAAVAASPLDSRKAPIVAVAPEVSPPVIAEAPAAMPSTPEEKLGNSSPTGQPQASEQMAASDAADTENQKSVASLRVARTDTGTTARGTRPTKAKNVAVSAYQQMTGDDNGGLPISLARDDVQSGMNAVASRVRKCAKKENRPIVMAVTISKNGTVADASATGTFAGTDIGECVARVVRTAVFPKSQRGVTVKYPFHL